MERIYRRLLADAKYFGAFRTTVPAVKLLLNSRATPPRVTWTGKI